MATSRNQRSGVTSSRNKLRQTIEIWIDYLMWDPWSWNTRIQDHNWDDITIYSTSGFEQVSGSTPRTKERETI